MRALFITCISLCMYFVTPSSTLPPSLLSPSPLFTLIPHPSPPSLSPSLPFTLTPHSTSLSPLTPHLPSLSLLTTTPFTLTPHNHSLPHPLPPHVQVPCKLTMLESCVLSQTQRPNWCQTNIGMTPALPVAHPSSLSCRLLCCNWGIALHEEMCACVQEKHTGVKHYLVSFTCCA